jgi:hypothetical protein
MHVEEKDERHFVFLCPRQTDRQSWLQSHTTATPDGSGIIKYQEAISFIVVNKEMFPNVLFGVLCSFFTYEKLHPIAVAADMISIKNVIYCTV